MSLQVKKTKQKGYISLLFSFIADRNEDSKLLKTEI